MKEKKASYDLLVRDVAETSQVAASIAKKIKGMSVCIELVGDVGAGKTTFTQTLVAALGSKDTVSSPTFTLENVYSADENKIYHFDLYRLQDAGLLPEEVHEALHEERSIVIIEWADLLHEYNNLPEDRIIISLEAQKESDTARKITITAPDALQLRTALLHEGIEL